MSASKLSVQLGLRYNWRISTLKVLHAGNLLCARVFIMRAGFRSPLLMFVPRNVMEPYGFIIVSFVPTAYFEGSVDDLDSFGSC